MKRNPSLALLSVFFALFVLCFAAAQPDIDMGSRPVYAQLSHVASHA